MIELRDGLAVLTLLRPHPPTAEVELGVLRVDSYTLVKLLQSLVVVLHFQLQFAVLQRGQLGVADQRLLLPAPANECEGGDEGHHRRESDPEHDDASGNEGSSLPATVPAVKYVAPQVPGPKIVRESTLSNRSPPTE